MNKAILNSIIPLIIGLSMIGCKTDMPEDAFRNLEIHKQIDKNHVDISNKSKDIKEKSMKIVKASQDIQKENDQLKEMDIIKNDKDANAKISKIADSAKVINIKSKEILQHNSDIMLISEDLKKISQESKDIEKDISKILKAKEKAEQERDQAIDNKNAGIHHMLKWLIFSCIIGAGGSFLLFLWLKSTAGILGAVGCIVTMAIAIFVEAYFTYLAILGGVLIASVLAIVIWQIWIRKKAISELINTVELTKDNLDIEKKEEIFGKDGEVGMMSEIQTPSTMKLVKGEKDKMSPLVRYLKNRNDLKKKETQS